ncbi:hypothetical protein Snoj_65880 [Streptomyces nojiriensis]|uniref:Uncharacterized protein n=1 Tax=Streptomyces nojiriensis TaxID=66374 RepID=A0ABQ3SX21_9ACTN|nr:hypothetical protein [Streptomyces nojiriensis]QTI46192.1 hypothetical protein JYK04_04003 [Streptomyces nojiriensis]GGR87336.1 hypothetical protein GCM10010205_14680 [Streptomyces nojiriensis]GHI72670.1 hypothetical protein Snoj_65880 [Streptomyces nojiriensis]
MRLTPFEWRVVTAYRAARGQGCRAVAAVCAGQLRLDRHVLAALIEYATDVGSPGVGAFGLRAAATGPCCLHLDADPSLLGYLVHRLSAADLGPEERCAGVRGRPDRLELRTRDGHGRIVFHLDAAGVHALGEWERDLALVHGGDRSTCRTEPLRPGVTRQGGGLADDVPASRELRRLLSRLPAVPRAHEASMPVRIEADSVGHSRM